MPRTDTGRRMDITSLQTLPCRVSRDIVVALQSLMVLQVVLGVSQAVNTGLCRSQVLARTLLLDGQQCLQGILEAAPRLRLQLGQLVGLYRPGQDGQIDEEAAAQALVELYVGLLLRWTGRDSHRRRVVLGSGERQRHYYRFSPVALPHVARARSSPLLDFVVSH